MTTTTDAPFDLFRRAQPAAAEALRQAVEGDAVAHAWLLLGPAGSGQDDAARWLGAALNCEQGPTGEPCGTCGPCHRVSAGTHTAVRDFAPEGTQHRVADVREEWIPTATRSAIEGRHKVLRIVHAERMNETAQNAFLKLLEEPPPSVVWILDAADDAALLDTIVSRCRRLDVTPWPRELLAERLRTWISAGEGDPGFGSGAEVPLTPPPGRVSKKFEKQLEAEKARHLPAPTEAEQQALVRLAKGSPQLLQELATCDGRKLRDATVTMLDRIQAAHPKEAGGMASGLVNEVLASAAETRDRIAAKFADEFLDMGRALGVLDEGGAKIRGRAFPPGYETREKKRSERAQRDAMVATYRRFLDLLSTYLQDVLAVANGAGPEALRNVDRLTSLQREAPRIAPAGLLRSMQAVEDAHTALDLNGDPKLQLERVLVQVVLACAAV